jgi:hypothetical protein
MKLRTILAISILAISTASLFGQFQKKTKMIGGNMDLYFEPRSPGAFGLVIHPTFGYFPAENFAVGLQLDTEFYSRSGDYYTSLGLGPMVRYYLGNESISAFGHFAYLASTTFYSNSDDTRIDHIIFPGIGINYMLFPNVGIEGLLAVYLGHVETTISLSVGFQIFIPPVSN